MLRRIAIGTVLIIAGALGLLWTRPPEKTIILGDACHTPARILGRAGSGAPTAIVFHGFAASPAIMEPLGQSLAESGWQVYLLDLAGHGRSSEHFSYAQVDRCAASALAYLYHSGSSRVGASAPTEISLGKGASAPEATAALIPARTILVGHSLGAAVAIHLAESFPAAATIAISPALLVPPKRPPPNLLIFAGQFDFSLVKQTARRLLRNAGGTHDNPGDFARRRASAFFILSGELHGAMVLDPRAWREILRWASRSLAPASPQSPRSAPIALPLAALFSNIALLAGMVLLVIPLLTLLTLLAQLMPAPPAPQPRHPEARAAGSLGQGPKPDTVAGSVGERSGQDATARLVGQRLNPWRPASFNWKSLLALWFAAAFLATSSIGLSRAYQYLRPVQLEDGDWVALVALLTAILLLFFLRQRLGEESRLNGRILILSAVTGIILIALFSWAARPELVETTLSVARLWRWAVLAAFVFPYFLAEEIALGPPLEHEASSSQSARLLSFRAKRGTRFFYDARGKTATRRFLLFLAMRGILWLAEAYAVLVFWPSGLLIVLLLIGLAIISIGQRLAADALRRRGAGIPAAALLDAILAAGTLALVLPLI